MDIDDLRSFVSFTPEAVRKEIVFETPRLWSQVLCFEPNQQLGPVGDPGSDAMFTVIAGAAVIQVNSRRKRVDQWGTVLVAAGDQVTITNATGDPLVVLQVAAPPPTPDGDDDT